MIYLDHAATTPISDIAMEVYLNVAKHYFGNSSSLHDEGSSAKQILDASTKTMATILNVRPKDIFFTSGATESNFLAINSLLKGRDGNHIITTAIEHSSVRNVFQKLQNEGYEVSFVPVNRHGQVKMSELKKLIIAETALVSIQHVNSEIGIIQDLEEIGAFLHSNNILLHSDCVQSFGRLQLNIPSLNVDAVSLSGHKIYGPKGVGAIWMNPKVNWKPFLPDTDNPGKFKSGTSDVPSIAAFATAAKKLNEERAQEQERIQSFREALIRELIKLPFELEIIEHGDKTVPNILGVRFPGIEGQFLMLECNQAGMAISTGSACQVGSEKPNKTMIAIGKNEQEAREFVRLSFGKLNNKDQISTIIQKINVILRRHFDKVNHHKSKKTSKS
jgi:cysteine desulfurase